MSDIKDDMSQTAKDFTDVVMPAIEDWFDADIVNVENTTDSGIAQKLDVNAGIDYWKIDDLMAGIGSRIQWLDETEKSDTPYNTFTIRCETPSGARSEYKKRLDAIEDDGLYPRHTIQAYLDTRSGELLSVAEVSTKRLIKYIKNGEQGERVWKNNQPKVEGGDYFRQHQPQDNDFYSIPWTALASNKHGIGVRKANPWRQGSPETVPYKDQTGLADFATDGGAP